MSKKKTDDMLDFRSGMETSDGKSGKNIAKGIVANIAIGVVTLGIPLFFIGRCSKADHSNDNKDNTESVRADSTMQSLWAQNHKMHDALLVANDSIGVLNIKNDSLQFACDSLASELDDCQSSKVAVVKPAPVKKETKKSSTVAKPSTVKPVAPVKKSASSVKKSTPAESSAKPATNAKPANKSQEQQKEIQSGSTTVNVNTPNNIINISEGGVINNYIEEPETEETIKEAIEMVSGYTKCYTNTNVRCK